MPTMDPGDRAPEVALEHPAFVYGSLDEFLEAMVPYVLDGAERGEPVFAAVGSEEASALRSAIGDLARVRVEDTNGWHPVPATRLRAFHSFVNDELHAGSSRVRLAGEPVWDAVHRPEFVREWARYESILNTVLAPFPVTLVCTYPAFRLDPAVVRDAHRTHPSVRVDGSARPSEAFEDPTSLVARWTPALGDPPGDARRSVFVGAAAARRFVTEQAARIGVSPARLIDLEVATGEVAANAVRHSRGGRIAVWRDDGYLVCQIEDDGGPSEPDALAGYRPPTMQQASGRGLWLVRQVVDLLQLASTPTGTAAKLFVRLVG